MSEVKHEQAVIEYVVIDKLIPYARNSRTHSSEQIAQLAASIKEFGFTVPVLVDGDNGIVAGHGRVMAAKLLGMTKVPTISVAYLTDTQRKAYIIADNKLALNAGWDEVTLKTELTELSEAGVDLSLTGFDPVELADLLLDVDLGGDGDEGEEGDEPMAAVIQYNIIFDSEQHQNLWYSFMKSLRKIYPDAETVSERLALWIVESKMDEEQ